MIPALMATQPLVKYGVLIGVPLLILTASHTAVYVKGKDVKQQEWNASIAKQAAASNKEVMAQAESTQRVLERHAQVEQQVREKIKIVDREVVRYVQSTNQPCELDAAAVRLFDAVSRVPDDPERVPAADGSPGESTESSSTGVTTDEVLQAYYTAVEQLALLWVDYAALVQWERGRYIVEKAGVDHE